jgi:hypothetical protein
VALRGCVRDAEPAGTYVLVTTSDAQEPAARVHLIATSGLDLGRHVGQEVTVVGEPARQARDPGAGATANDRGAGVHGDAPGEAAGARFFRVTSVDKVEGRCATR